MDINIRKNRFVDFNNYYTETSKKDKDNIQYDESFLKSDRLYLVLCVSDENDDPLIFFRTEIAIKEEFLLNDTNSLSNYPSFLKKIILEGKIKNHSDFLRYGFQEMSICSNTYWYNAHNVNWIDDIKDKFLNNKLLIYYTITLHSLKPHIFYYKSPISIDYCLNNKNLLCSKNYRNYNINSIFMFLGEEDWLKLPEVIQYRRLNKIYKLKNETYNII